MYWWWEAKEIMNIKREYVTSFVKTKYLWTIERYYGYGTAAVAGNSSNKNKCKIIILLALFRIVKNLFGMENAPK